MGFNGISGFNMINMLPIYITLELWLTVCHGFSMALIEIDGLPNLKMVDLSMANCEITRWYKYMTGQQEDQTWDFWNCPSNEMFHGFLSGDLNDRWNGDLIIKDWGVLPSTMNPS